MTEGCPGCLALHVPDDEVRAVIEAEKGRGLWKHKTVDAAVALAFDTRRYPCEHPCHRRVIDKGEG